jgi:AraC-like DNA-binding protein
MAGFLTIVESLGMNRGPLREPRHMFPRTLGFSFAEPETAFFETRRGQLGASGVELWTVLSSGHEIRLDEPGRATFLMPAAGRLDVAASGREHHARPGGGLFFTPNSRTTRVAAPPGGAFKAQVILLSGEALRRAHGDRRRGCPVVETSLGSGRLPGVHAALQSYGAYLFSALSPPDSPLLRNRTLEASAALLLELFGSLFEHASDEPARGEPEPGLAQVRRAIEIMEARYAEPLCMADLAREIGVSLRSLQIGFRRHRGATPREALGAIRLDAARRRLLGSDRQETVTEIALDCGFTHLGRFSAAYRKAFGERPAETAGRRAAPRRAVSRSG